VCYVLHAIKDLNRGPAKLAEGDGPSGGRASEIFVSPELSCGEFI